MKNTDNNYNSNQIQDKIQEFAELKSLEEKSSIIENIVEIFDSEENSTEQLELFAAFLQSIINCDNLELRKAMAKNIQYSKKIPINIILEITKDIIEVSKPILNNSPVLTANHLIDLFKKNISYAHNTAIISGRNVPSSLIDYVIDTNDIALITNLIANEEIIIDESKYNRIIDDCNGNKGIMIAIASCNNITIYLKNKLLAKMSEFHNESRSKKNIKYKKMI